MWKCLRRQILASERIHSLRLESSVRLVRARPSFLGETLSSTCVMYDNTNTPTHTWEREPERADSFDLTLSWVFLSCRWSEGVWGEAGMISCSVVCSGRLESVFWGPLRHSIIYPLHLLFMFHWSFRQTHPSSLCGTVLWSLTGTRLPPRGVFLTDTFQHLTASIVDVLLIKGSGDKSQKIAPAMCIRYVIYLREL